jgi:hypothetical protein
MLGSVDNQISFILSLTEKWGVPTKTNRKGHVVLDTKKLGPTDEFICKNWDYEVCKPVLREMFTKTEKYNRGKNGKELFKSFKEQYKQKGYTDYRWPFISGQFDNYAVKAIVYPAVGDISTFDNNLIRVQQDVEKFSYLKIFNTLRNDYLEYLIFHSDEDIIPTFSHRGGLDFFIHGMGYDQKVSRSVTNQFMEKHGDDWRNKALENPLEVAKFLMELGDESRFSNVPRLFVIDVDGSYELDGIEEMVSTVNFQEPQSVSYQYQHKSGVQNYSCPVLCLLLTSKGKD